MKQQIRLSLSAFLFLPVMLSAQDETEIKSEVKEVTVFLTGAEETRTAKTTIKEGNSTLRFTDLPAQIDPNSIRVDGISDFTILSINFVQNYLSSKEEEGEIKIITDRLDSLQLRSGMIAREKSLLHEEKSMMQANNRLTNNNGLVIEDLVVIADYYAERYNEIEYRLVEIQQEETKIYTATSNVNKQLQEMRYSKNKATGEVLVTINAKKSAATDLRISYYTQSAGWRPFYDVRSSETTGPVNLSYKAHVYQTTGTDWENVKLTLSTTTPNMSNDKPYVPVWELDFVSYVNVYKQQNAVSNYSGYPISNTISNLESSGGTSAYSYAWDAGGRFTATQNAVNTEFNIKTPYSIPSNGNEYVVEINNLELPAQYRYSTVPKMGEDAFLMARIGGWYEYNLLPAETNIYFKGTYVGKSFLNTLITDDTLEVSMGSDEAVVVKRKCISGVNSKTVTGSSKKQTDEFEISIRNTKSTAIEIEVEDQIPVSKQKEIVVEAGETSDAEYNKEDGKLKWKMKLAPGETKTVKFGYSVKFPKNYYINNL